MTRDRHSEKHLAQSVSTEAGRQTDVSDEHFANAETQIDDSLESDSNATVESERHRAKDERPRVSTDEGRQIDERNEQFSNAKSAIDDSFAPD
jgi:hypothetical protein